jgi:hypothetical protein
MSMNCSGSISAADNNQVIFTLPEGYRPVNDIIINYPSQKGEILILCVRANGNVEVNTLNQSINGFFLRQMHCWITP